MSTGNKKSITYKMHNEIKKNKNKIANTSLIKDSIANKPEKNSVNQKDIQDFPEDQNSG